MVLSPYHRVLFKLLRQILLRQVGEAHSGVAPDVRRELVDAVARLVFRPLAEGSLRSRRVIQKKRLNRARSVTCLLGKSSRRREKEEEEEEEEEEQEGEEEEEEEE